MTGFALLLGHLVGDYVVQNDWMAKNKTNPYPETAVTDSGINTPHERLDELDRFKAQLLAWELGHAACTLHCFLYTLAVWAFSFWWMPAWGLAVCFAIHWPIDRFRLAGWWMRNVSGQAYFASDKHPLFPWSVVVVDNIFHLLTLYGIWAAATFM